MYLDLEDYRPDTPRVPAAISVREGVLLSLLVHALLVIAWLITPPLGPATPMVPVDPSPDAVRFVQMMPTVELQRTPKPQVEQSDLDRRAAAPAAAPSPDNSMPMSQGNTPEKVVGAPSEKPSSAEPPASTPPTSSVVPDIAAKVSTDAPASMLRPASTGLGSQLRNLQQFLQNENFDNQKGGQSDQNADIQFDSKGVEFGPWLRRFIQQVKRNWYVPQAAMSLRGHVVIQFYVLKNGTITDLKIVQPSAIESFNTAAFNSLKLSNPTLALPPGYPDDKALFTVTFHYNEGIER